MVLDGLLAELEGRPDFLVAVPSCHPLQDLELPLGQLPQRPNAGPLGELTEREFQILERVAAGDSNKEIGATLQLSEKTVKHHMTNILQKLQVRNRVEAALLARGNERPT